jgi:pilus assembly protein CpaB
MTSTTIKPARSTWGRFIRMGGLIAIVVASGAIAVIGANSYIERELQRQRVASKAPVVRTLAVVVAKYPLERGERVGRENMAIREVPADFLPASVVLPDQFDPISGMRLTRAMRSGEPLLHEALAEVGPDPLATRLPAGRRAVTIMADEVNSVSGMLRPGDRIDLLFTARDSLAAEQGGVGDLTRPLLQDVRILATGSQLDSTQPRGPGASSFGTITVEVSPDQAKQLVLAQRGGRLTALLRGPDDRHEIGTGSLDLAALLGRARPARSPVPPAPVERPAMEIIVGGIGRTPPAVAVPAVAVPAVAVPAVAAPADAPQAPVMRPSDSKPSSTQRAPFHRVDEANGSGMFPVAAQPHLIR